MRQGRQWAYSDTMGITRNGDGRLSLSRASKENPDFMRTLSVWMEGFAEDDKPFVFSSISMNFDYNAAIHRAALSYALAPQRPTQKL